MKSRVRRFPLPSVALFITGLRADSRQQLLPEALVNRNLECRFTPRLLGVQGCSLEGPRPSITVPSYLRNGVMDWPAKPRPGTVLTAIQLVMVRGRHYYSYITDCSQSKQSQDEVSDPPTAFSRTQKKKRLETTGEDIVLNSGLLSKLPSDLVDFFLFFFLPFYPSFFSTALQIVLFVCICRPSMIILLFYCYQCQIFPPRAAHSPPFIMDIASQKPGSRWFSSAELSLSESNRTNNFPISNK